MPRSLEGSIYRTPDGRRWFARLRYTDAAGRPREKKRTCPTHAAAKATLAKLKSEIDADLADRKTYRQVDRFYREKYVHPARFAGGQLLSGFRQSTDTVRHYLDPALEFFGDRYIDSITYADLCRYKDLIADTPKVRGGQRSISDLNHHLKRLRRLLNVAVEQGWLAVNPFKRGGSLIVESFEVERTRIVSPVEEMRLLAACDKWRKHLKPIIIFAIETGCRRGEMRALTWFDIDLAGRVIRVNGTSTKTLKSRLVPITARLADTLAQLRHNVRPKDSAAVFGMADWKKAFNSAAADAGLSDLRFHDLRHTAITRMLEKGISPPLVMKISGHTQQRTFMRYVNQSESSIYEIAMRLDRAA